MSKVCKYAVIRYVPDEIREEFINIGLVFHSPEDRSIDIKFTKNFSRVSKFDDEIDIEFLKLVLEGIKEEFSQSTISGPSNDSLADINFIENNTFFYSNQIQFSPTYIINSTDLVQDFMDLFRTYVYFDVQKKSRITDDEVKSMMNRILKSNDSFKKLEKNIPVNIGPQTIELDYVYNTNDRKKIIKTFSFDYTDRKSSQATLIAKEWFYNYEKMLNSSDKSLGINRDSLDIVTFVYTGARVNKNTKTAIEILRELTDIVEGKQEGEIFDFAKSISDEIELYN